MIEVLWYFGGNFEVSNPTYPFLNALGSLRLTPVVLRVSGGICPGVNDVIQNLVSRLHAYGVPEGNVLGIKYGVRGFLQKDCKPVVLTQQNTDGIHLNGKELVVKCYANSGVHFPFEALIFLSVLMS
jgi:hypothetical protein